MILTVDDDEDIRATIRQALELLSYGVIEAESGAAALRLLESHRPELAILDFVMPGMDGVELAALIHERDPALPIIFASGYADADGLKDRIGQDLPILPKPFRIDELADLVERFRRPAP